MYNNDFANRWTDFKRHILDSCGFANIWTEQCTAIYTVKWISPVTNTIYKIYKQKFGLEK